MMSNKLYHIQEAYHHVNELNKLLTNDEAVQALIGIYNDLHVIKSAAQREIKEQEVEMGLFRDLTRVDGIVRNLAGETLVHAVEAIPEGYNSNKHKREIMDTALKMEVSNV